MLTIEDGTGVSGANSYATVAEARAYATARGLTFPADDSDVESALVMACDKLETSYRYKGNKTFETYPLEWPRKFVFIGASLIELDRNSIPAKLKQAQCQLAYDSTLTELQPTGTGKEVIREKVDVLEVEYAQKGDGSVTPEFNKAEAILQPLLLTGGSFNLTTYRV